MPIQTNKKINLENLVLPEEVNKTRDFSNSVKYIKKERKDQLPTLTINPILIKKFRQEAKNKKWLLTTLMEEILCERYNIKLEDLQNEND